MNDSDGIARSLPRISPYRGGEPVLQRNTRFSVSWAWCYAPKPSRCHLLHLFSLSRSGEPVLQGNTRFSVLLKAPRHKKMRGSNPYVGALPLCGKNRLALCAKTAAFQLLLLSILFPRRRIDSVTTST